ncbi:MAG: DUF6259 domain-containing protein [Alicyclobacillus sp.]|nr:DUF6259 domain-containing protein [Alicyclobacillus sp.]
MITLENERIRIAFCEANGSLIGLTDKAKCIEYVDGGGTPEPLRMKRSTGWSSEFTEFEYHEIAEDGGEPGVLLIWRINADVKVVARVNVPRDANEAIFRVDLINNSDEWILALEYPIIGKLRQITDGGVDDRLAHSYATGFLIKNPLATFASDGDGFRFMPYPESFSGATMQFFTYYGQGRGGLYFAAEDSECHAKWLNFYRRGDRLEASFIHGYADVGAKKGVHPPYPVVVKLMNEGNWYEAAEEYKRWARKQPWTQRGPLAEVDTARKARWLLEEIGLATFGINASHDRTKWIQTYHKLADTSVFHVTGPDWPRAGQTYTNCLPGGFDDWFPTRFCQENIETFRRLGDRFAPFEFDYLFNFDGADGDRGKHARHIMPPEPMSIDKYKFPFICPADPYTRELHIRRDEHLAQEVSIDAIYYDISANNILKVCMDPSHGHPVGGGREITVAYRDNYRDTKEAMTRVAGKYVAMGTEMVNEVFIDLLDFYQARAGAQPATSFEGWNIRHLLKTGEAELIPLFTYVYHEYGPVRLDGWGNLTREIGQLFYYTVARTYLWGGVYELNYEYCPMEAIDEEENPAEEHYYTFEPRGYELAPERGEYLRQFARLRTGKGNKYLAYGVMQRPLRFETDTVCLDWFHYNSGLQTPSYNDRGELTVDAVVHSAWRYRHESLGFFFSNVTEARRVVRVSLDLSAYELAPGSYAVDLWDPSNDSVTRLTELEQGDRVELEVSVPARGVVMVEIH